jgi:rhodanese-related sulfurtransferase/predicted metal-dependent enzyme (double-stranded beta helix superfamily)
VPTLTFTSDTVSPLGSLLSRTDCLNAGDLAVLTERLANAPELWQPLIQHDPLHRWYERLLLTPIVEVWLIGWAPGQGTPPHDHGGTEGAMTVVQGTLSEDVYEGVTLQDAEVHPARTLTRHVGSVAMFGLDHVHRVRNLGQVNASSIHAYSPPGKPMRWYGIEAQRQVAGRARTVDQMVRQARGRLVRLEAVEASSAVARGALLIDIRPEAQRGLEGSVPGALVVERNLLEWRLDPKSPWRIPLIRDHRQQVIVLCSEGYTSSLAAASLQELGLTNATDVVGGFTAWSAAGLPTTFDPSDRPTELHRLQRSARPARRRRLTTGERQVLQGRGSTPGRARVAPAGAGLGRGTAAR